jgi:hypothetical protein
MKKFYISESNHKDITDSAQSLHPKYKVKLGFNSYKRALDSFFDGKLSQVTLFYNGTSRRVIGDCVVGSPDREFSITGETYSATLIFCGPITYEAKQ